MGQADLERRYDLHDRTFELARRVRAFGRRLPRTVCNYEDGRQVVRSSGSVGANYIEASEALSKKEFHLKLRICRREAKETAYWLKMLDGRGDGQMDAERSTLVQESCELVKIFSAILQKSERRSPTS
jgi:four helix bundle protein